MRIEGSVAVVTGGAQGIGRSIAENFAENGATVLVFDRNEKALRNLKRNIEGICVDVLDPIQVDKAVAEVTTRHGQIDILVNNAGVISSEPFISFGASQVITESLERFRTSIRANLESVFVVTYSVSRHMIASRVKGAIVNITSISSTGNEGQTAYSAAKAGVSAMTVTWSKELGRWGIRCNAISPGFIDTESTNQELSEHHLRQIRETTPLRRLGKAEEVTQAVIAVIENDFINGATLEVTGGLRI